VSPMGLIERLPRNRFTVTDFHYVRRLDCACETCKSP
jgi:hypothetical protein